MSKRVNSIGRALAYLAGAARFISAYDEFSKGAGPNLSKFRTRAIDALNSCASEYRRIMPEDRGAVEDLLGDILTKTPPQFIFGAALRGQAELAVRLLDQPFAHAGLMELPPDAREYLRHLVCVVSAQLCELTANSQFRDVVVTSGLAELLAADHITQKKLDEIAYASWTLKEVVYYVGDYPYSASRQTIHIPVAKETTIGQFLDKVWFSISEFVEPYTYGDQWRLIKILRKPNGYSAVRSSHSKTSPDTRLLSDVISSHALEIEVQFLRPFGSTTGHRGDRSRQASQAGDAAEGAGSVDG